MVSICSPLLPLCLNVLPAIFNSPTACPFSFGSSLHFNRRVTSPLPLTINSSPFGLNLALTPGDVDKILNDASLSFWKIASVYFISSSETPVNIRVTSPPPRPPRLKPRIVARGPLPFVPGAAISIGILFSLVSVSLSLVSSTPLIITPLIHAPFLLGSSYHESFALITPVPVILFPSLEKVALPEVICRSPSLYLPSPSEKSILFLSDDTFNFLFLG